MTASTGVKGAGARRRGGCTVGYERNAGRGGRRMTHERPDDAIQPGTNVTGVTTSPPAALPLDARKIDVPWAPWFGAALVLVWLAGDLGLVLVASLLRAGG